MGPQRREPDARSRRDQPQRQHVGVKGIAFNGYTAKNVFFHNGADCAHFGENVVIEDSLCVDGPDANGDGWPDGNAFCNVQNPDHFDGFQSDGGNNIVIRHNTLRNPCEQTSNVLLSSNTSHISNVDGRPTTCSRAAATRSTAPA